MVRNSARIRAPELLPDLSATELHLCAAQTKQLLAAGAAPSPPAVSPPASIIPSPGSPPPTPNWSSPIVISSQDYVIAAGTYLFSTGNMYMISGSSSSHRLINNGTLWMDGSLPLTMSGPLGSTLSINTDVLNTGLAVSIARRAVNVPHTDAIGFREFYHLENTGNIFALSEYGFAYGLYTSAIPLIKNSGLIAARTDIGAATAIQLFNGGTLTNQAGGQILAEAVFATAIHFGGGGHSTDVPSGTVNITNAGLIRAASLDPSTPSVGLSLSNLDVDRETIKVVNSGSIIADIAITDDSSGAFSPVQNAAQNITNLSGGLIQGLIFLERGNDTLDNSGTLRGNIFMGEGNDRFDSTTGSVEGVVDLGWGADSYKGSAGADFAAGDDGNDVMEGNAGNDQLMGGANDDTLTGGAGNDGLFGEYGNDRIVTQGGDFVSGGAGDDRIELGDYQFEHVMGDAGFDTLVLPTGARVLDLAAMIADQRIEGFEMIALNGGKELVVRSADIPLISGGGTVLRIDGTGSDKVDLIGAWADKGNVTVDGASWHQYELDGRMLLIASGVAVAPNATPPAGAGGLDPFAGGSLAPIPGDGGIDFTPNELYLRGYDMSESLTINPEEIWWNDGGAPILVTGSFSLTNLGTLLTFGDGGGLGTFMQIVDLHGFQTFVNRGTAAAHWGFDDGADHSSQESLFGLIYGTVSGGSMSNYGLIEATTVHGLATAAWNPWSLHNYGDVHARSEKGFAIGVDDPGGLDNRGSILVEGGMSAIGVNLKHGSSATNDGLIEAYGTAPGALSVGVQFELDSSSPTYLFTNNATIVGAFALLELKSNYSGFRPLDVTNNGSLIGMVELGKANDALTNKGTITGAIRLLDGDDVFDGSGGLQGGEVHGGLGNDQLTGGRGADRLFGDEGNDILKAGSGNDWLEGGAGADTFVFTAPGDSHEFAQRSDGHKLRPDVIADFAPGTDKIDLSAIDAITGTGANDAFNFIGSAAFSHQAGQVRFETAGGFTSIFADMDGDGFADMQIILKTPVTLTAADFVL